MSLNFGPENDVAFGHTYSKGLLWGHVTFLSLVLMITLQTNEERNFYAEFGQAWTSSWFLIFQTTLHILLVCYTKHKHGPLPPLVQAENSKAKARQASGIPKIDFTKGPLLRRVMQRIKYYKMQISNVQYLAKGVFTLLIYLVAVTYVVFCFGAPLNFSPFTYIFDYTHTSEANDFSETTLSFGILMTLHTGLPIVLIYGSDTIGGLIIYVFFRQPEEPEEDDDNKACNNGTMQHSRPVTVQAIYANAMGAFIGSWFGAFPIPLDWDRPWQVWPRTCNIGLVGGVVIGNLISLYKIMKLRKKYNLQNTLLTSIKTKKS